MTNRYTPNSNPLWFEHLSRTKEPSLRLFCFPYAGGSSEIYRGWQRWLPEQVDVCLVHLPGRGKRFGEQPFTRLPALVQAIADRISLELEGPYALFGHSMGALISFELSRELFRRNSTAPERLFVSGRSAPHLPSERSVTFNLPHDELIAEVKRLNGTPPEVLENPELMEIFISPLRADFEIVETYKYCPEEPLPSPITVYGGLQDEHVPLEHCRAWNVQTSAGCNVRMFAGDHFFIREPQSDFIAAFRKDVVNTLPVPRLK